MLAAIVRFLLLTLILILCTAQNLSASRIQNISVADIVFQRDQSGSLLLSIRMQLGTDAVDLQLRQRSFEDIDFQVNQASYLPQIPAPTFLQGQGVSAMLIDNTLKLILTRPEDGVLYKVDIDVASKYQRGHSPLESDSNISECCGVIDAQQEEFAATSIQVNPTQSPFFPPKVVTLSTDADFEFLQKYSGDIDRAFYAIQEMVNIAESIYSQQLGITFKVLSQNIFTEKSQPYQSNSLQDLLRQFKEHNTDSKHLRAANIFHLFSGKDSDVVGFAYLRSVCKSPAMSYSVSRKPLRSDHWSVFTHEIAHNLGATHDPLPGSLMSLESSGRISGFSNHSLAEIQSFLARNSSCLSTSRDYGFPLELRSSGKGYSRFELEYEHPFLRHNCETKVYASRHKELLSGTIPTFDGLTAIWSGNTRHSQVKVRRRLITATKGRKRPLYFRSAFECNEQRVYSRIQKLRVRKPARYLQALKAS